MEMVGVCDDWLIRLWSWSS